MKWCRSNGRVLTLMLALAFFNFIFLGIEYQFDNMMALVTGPEQVVTAQGYVLGASVLGFLLYPAAASKKKKRSEAGTRPYHRNRTFHPTSSTLYGSKSCTQVGRTGHRPPVYVCAYYLYHPAT